MVTRLGLDVKKLGVRFQAGAEIFLFSTVSKSTLGHTKPLVQLEVGAKQPTCESDLLLVPELRMKGATPTVPHTF
jgi:hypothetical protein